jgi:hypothetical protein
MGLLDRFNRGMGALETGLLGNATTFNPQLAQYLSPGVMQSAQKDARMQLGLAMLAASESGMGFGQGMMMAQQMAGQAFQRPLEQDLQGNMQIQALEKIKEQKTQEASYQEWLKANPEIAQQIGSLPKQVQYQIIAAEMSKESSPQDQWVTLSNDEARKAGYDPSLGPWQRNAKDGQIAHRGTRPPQAPQGPGPTEVQRNAVMLFPGDPAKQREWITQQLTSPNSTGDVLGPILAKKARGEILSSGEKEIYDKWQKGGQISPLMMMLGGQAAGGEVDFGKLPD